MRGCFVLPTLMGVSLGLFGNTVLATESADIVVYGGNSAGIIAAIEAKANGKSVILIEPSIHLGGLTTGGRRCDASWRRVNRRHGRSEGAVVPRFGSIDLARRFNPSYLFVVRWLSPAASTTAAV